MPSTSIAAPSGASRRNGALSRGPATSVGKAGSAGNGTRDDLAAAEFCPAPHEEAQLTALLDDLARRYRPQGEAEAGLPSPATVLRYRARLQRDHAHAMPALPPAPAPRGRATVENPNPRPDMAARLAQPEAEAAADTGELMARLLAMRGAGGKDEPEPTTPLARNSAPRRRMEAWQRQAAQV
ncbi:hypothetical protein [Marinimicrococcus flavescens]|uniref:Uncharacterized protein n=1 Tax=Marinimicrococcus flavescens TaxID=3031815 RepID=A0AAP3XQC2_9PROT|nr:hypothetical protein [Marinimicrococcus flavescens]